MIAPDMAIRDVLIGYRTRPRVASRFNHRSGGGSIHHYLTTLHARLYEPTADLDPLPRDLDELRLWALTGGKHQQEPVLTHLAAQLPRTARLLQYPLQELRWPADTLVWMRDADRAIRQLADQVHRVSPAFALPHAPQAQAQAAPTTTATGTDPTPHQLARALADFVAPDIAPDDVLLRFRPHPRTGQRFTAREANAASFGSLLHARLYGLEAAASPRPWDELSQLPRATTGQQTAALARLSGQLHSAGDILTWAQHWSHWRQLPRDIHAQLGIAATTVHELADGISQIPTAPRTALATTPVFVPPAAPPPAPPRR